MKKILSLALAVMMLVSAVPMVYAADIGFGQSTTITLYGEDAESYSIDVPATLQPGQSGTVSVSGKWGSNKTMTVTCPDTVTLYYGEQSMNVGIEFADIALVGSCMSSRRLPTACLLLKQFSTALQARNMWRYTETAWIEVSERIFTPPIWSFMPRRELGIPSGTAV